MSDGYTVVPESLLSMSRVLRGAHQDWLAMRGDLDRLVLQSLSLGVLGEASNYPASYNGIKDDIVDRLAQGEESIHDTSRALEKVAKFYAEKDAEYYEQFGYIESEMD
jgi:hypothetical protein